MAIRNRFSVSKPSFLDTRPANMPLQSASGAGTFGLFEVSVNAARG